MVGAPRQRMDGVMMAENTNASLTAANGAEGATFRLEMPMATGAGEPKVSNRAAMTAA